MHPLDETAGQDREPTAGVGSLAFWALVGALIGFGVAGLLTIGLLLLLVAAGLFVVGLARPAIDKRALPALFPGAAAAPLAIAWGNRQGPGLICGQDGTVTWCSEQWNPWPFAAAGIALILIGAALIWYTFRRHPRGSREPRGEQRRK